MDAEIHAEPDKKHGKGHRDQVEPTDHQGGEACRDHQAGNQGEECRRDQTNGAEPPDQENRDAGGRQEAGPDGTAAGTLQLLMFKHRGAGQPKRKAMLGIDIQPVGRLSQRRDRLGAGGKRAVVEARFHQDEFSCPLAGSAKVEKALPGEVGRIALRRGVDDAGHLVEEIVEFITGNGRIVTVLQHKVDEVGKAAEVGIIGERRQQRLGCGEPITQLDQRVQVEIEKPVLPEKGIVARQVDLGEMCPVRCQLVCEPSRRIGTSLGRVAVDDRDDIVAECRKNLAIGDLVLAKGDLFRDHVVGIGVDAQMARRVEERHHHQKQGCGHDKTGMVHQPLMLERPSAAFQLSGHALFSLLNLSSAMSRRGRQACHGL